MIDDISIWRGTIKICVLHFPAHTCRRNAVSWMLRLGAGDMDFSRPLDYLFPVPGVSEAWAHCLWVRVMLPSRCHMWWQPAALSGPTIFPLSPLGVHPVFRRQRAATTLMSSSLP